MFSSWGVCRGEEGHPRGMQSIISDARPARVRELDQQFSGFDQSRDGREVGA